MKLGHDFSPDCSETWFNPGLIVDLTRFNLIAQFVFSQYVRRSLHPIRVMRSFFQRCHQLTSHYTVNSNRWIIRKDWRSLSQKFLQSSSEPVGNLFNNFHFKHRFVLVRVFVGRNLTPGSHLVHIYMNWI